jgi:thiamine-phosphate pyrophosphorylase
MPLDLPTLYAITDVRLSGLPHVEQVRRLAAGGATLVQLRDKNASPRDFHAAAAEVMAIAGALGVRIMINDRVDLALAVGAAGVHLGQDDLPPAKARQILGPSRILGFSTHNLSQAVAADSEPVDYIAIGPIFTTASKDRPDPVVGLEMLREVKSRVSKPVVAIGGITLSSAKTLMAAGADSVAVISDLVASGDITSRTAEYLRELSSIRP